MTEKRAIVTLLLALAAAFVIYWFGKERAKLSTAPPLGARRAWLYVGIGAVTDFLDTLGIGSFATTTTAFRLTRSVDDRRLPGTMNVGHALPTVLQASIYITLVEVEVTTLITMIGSAVTGAFIGSGVVSRLPRRSVQLFMGLSLCVAVLLLAAGLAKLMPAGGTNLGLTLPLLAAGCATNFLLGALMSAGIGLYAPCMILVSVLGMNPSAAFPIMMGSCAFLMPISGFEFIRRDAYDVKAALGLAVGGLPAVWVAAFVVRSLPLDGVRYLVIGVASYTAYGLLRAALRAGASA